MKFSKYIRAIRKKDGHGSLTAFAGRIGISPASLNRLIVGSVISPRLDLLRRIEIASGGSVKALSDFDFERKDVE
jgi:DNA-binding transcriptional regulator YdaS (Cro superfamily)